MPRVQGIYESFTQAWVTAGALALGPYLSGAQGWVSEILQTPKHPEVVCASVHFSRGKMEPSSFSRKGVETSF